jgi:hypothetical protein
MVHLICDSADDLLHPFVNFGRGNPSPSETQSEVEDRLCFVSSGHSPILTIG